MQFGIPTLIETENIEECAELCNELGFDFIEINMNLPQYQAENIDFEYFNQVKEKYGIYYTIHLDENLNVCDFNTKVANAYAETVFQTIELAGKLNIPVLNMHMVSGVYFTLPGEKRYLFSEYADVYLNSLEYFRDKCEALIGNQKIIICIENTGIYKLDFIRKGLDLLLKSPVFGLTFDIGHNANTGNSAEAYINGHLKRLKHMHMHDALTNIGHLPLGEGQLDLAGYFDLAEKYDCRIVIETKTVEGLKKSRKWLDANI